MTDFSLHTWRLLLPQNPFTTPDVLLPEEEHHYVFNVLRLKVGSDVQLTNGEGSIASGKIVRTDKKGTLVEIHNVLEKPRAKSRIHLYLGCPKPATLDEIIDFVAEQGACEVHIFKTQKCQSKAPFKLEKLQKNAFEALRISKSPWATKIFCYDTLEEFLSSKPQSLDFLCDESPIYTAENPNTHIASLTETLQKIDKSQTRLGIFVGPESSFTEAERTLIHEKTKATPVSLGQNILRVPTACVSAVGIAVGFCESREKTLA
jgi:16S rRNA (uracil1498-N3)-methyltransferase